MLPRPALAALVLLPLVLAPALAPEAAAQPALTARVDPNPPRTTAPATVHFHAIPEGGAPPFTFRWDLGDGLASTEQVARREFASGGTYRARVTIADSAGARATAEGVVQVAPDLQLVAGSDFRGGRAPLDVVLEASASGGTPPYAFTWDLGPRGGIVAGAVQRVHLPDPCACGFSATVVDAWGAMEQVDFHVLTDPPGHDQAVLGPALVALGGLLLAGLLGARRLRRRRGP